VNDIEKLNSVIDTLESQSSSISEFSGVLESINSSRKKIDSANKTLLDINNEQKVLLIESYNNFEEFGKRLDNQGSRLSTLESMQKKMQKDVATLAKLINGASDKQQSAIKSLQLLLISGLAFIMLGVIVVL
jgi:DNA repair ATPase RecN